MPRGGADSFLAFLVKKKKRRKWQQLHCRSELTAATGEAALRKATAMETMED